MITCERIAAGERRGVERAVNQMQRWEGGWEKAFPRCCSADSAGLFFKLMRAYITSLACGYGRRSCWWTGMPAQCMICFLKANGGIKNSFLPLALDILNNGVIDSVFSLGRTFHSAACRRSIGCTMSSSVCRCRVSPAPDAPSPTGGVPRATGRSAACQPQRGSAWFSIITPGTNTRSVGKTWQRFHTQAAWRRLSGGGRGLRGGDSAVPAEGSVLCAGEIQFIRSCVVGDANLPLRSSARAV